MRRRTPPPPVNPEAQEQIRKNIQELETQKKEAQSEIDIYSAELKKLIQQGRYGSHDSK